MNLLTEGEPLYQLQQFYQHTDTENLFGGVNSRSTLFYRYFV